MSAITPYMLQLLRSQAVEGYSYAVCSQAGLAPQAEEPEAFSLSGSGPQGGQYEPVLVNHLRS